MQTLYLYPHLLVYFAVLMVTGGGGDVMENDVKF